MLSTLLNSVQTTLLGSKGFLVTSLLPVVLFFISSGWFYSRLPGRSGDTWTAWLSQSPGLTGTLTGLAILTFALAFSSLNTFLREILEGKPLRLLPKLEKKVMAGQLVKADAAKERFVESQREYWKLRRANWLEELRKERKRPNTAAGAPKAAAPAPPADLVTRIEGIETAMGKYEVVSFSDMEEAYNGLLAELRQYRPAVTDALSKLHVQFYNAVPVVEKRLDRERLDAYWKMNEYADVPEPTRLGNIGAAMRFYAETRYQMSLDVFWPRLQRAIQEDDKLFSTMQDAKIQLDLFVSCTWLATLFALIWIPWLTAAGTDWITFLLAWMAAPVVAWGSYHLACVSYQGFAQVVRAAIDVQRFQLLKELHLALPPGLDEERDLWRRLGDWLGYNSVEGEFLYKRD